jgi:DNA polymerase I
MRRIVVDFEFKIDDAGRNPPRIRCMVAMDIGSGQTWSMWEDELYATPVCPFPTGPDVQIICFQAKAEGRCFATLGWHPPARVVDLMVERLRLLNPAPWPSMLDTLAAYGLPAMSSEHKQLMRLLIMHGEFFTPEQRVAILRYCLQDVVSTARLMQAMDAAGHIRWEQAEWRGTCNFCYGYIEDAGVPIDTATYRQFVAQRGSIMLAMVTEAQTEHGFDTYEGADFNFKKFAIFLARHGITDWPLTPFGRLAVSDLTMERMTPRYPVVAPIHQLRKQLDQMRAMDLSIGDDGRNRFDFNTFGSVTMRCQPGTSANVMAGPKWIRGLVRADPSRPYVLAVIDWAAQEFGLGASLSGDPVMQQSYHGEDVHIGTAIATAQAPPGATGETHPRARKIGKAINFCLMYGGGVPGLAAKLRCPPHEAAALLASTKAAFEVFERWSDHGVAAAQCRGWMEAPLGWRVDATKVGNARTLRNWRMQTGGSEMLQAAIVLLMAGTPVRIVCTMHDAIMLELPIESWRADLDRVRAVMEAASEVATGGLRIRTEPRVMLPGQRYVQEGDDGWDQWQLIMRSMGQEKAA